MSKMILDFEEDIFDEPIFLTGIVSQLPDYQLVFQLNKHLRTTFVDSVAPFIHRSKNIKASYRMYYSPAREEIPEVFFVNNQSFTNVLISNFEDTLPLQHKLLKSSNNFDYYLLSTSISMAPALKTLSLKKHIITYFNVDIERLKKEEFQIINNIIFHKHEQS